MRVGPSSCKKNKDISLLLLLSCNLFSSKHGWDGEKVPDVFYLFKLQNNSDFDILSYQASGDWNQPTMYPDTLLPLAFYGGDGLDMMECMHLIPSGEDCGFFPYHKPAISKKEFEQHFESGIYSVFIIDAQTAMHEKSWEEIQEDYDILVRYDLTFDDLKALGKTVPFPPTEEMKGMKMFPSYDEVTERCRPFVDD